MHKPKSNLDLHTHTHTHTHPKPDFDAYIQTHTKPWFIYPITQT